MVIEFEDSEVKKVLQVIVDYFKSNEVKINNLNVFPVPDGDTGTNMLLTLKSIKKELSKLKQFDIKNIGEAVSFGGLMGARGNSGVILSQILKGFFDILSKNDSDINLAVFEIALNSAKNLAYSSVQNPAEGTMLTLIKDLYLFMKNFNELNDKDISFLKLIDNLISEAEKSLIRTTYLLPVLKEANVVDAGAQGVLEILKGLRQGFVEVNKVDGSLKTNKNKGTGNDVTEASGKIPEDKTYKEAEIKGLKDWNINSDIKYIYCTEFILTGQRINISRLRDDIENMGDSAMVVGNENLVKIHVHSNNPHRVLARALREGILHEIQINNMVDQNKEKIKLQAIPVKAVPPTIGLISVSNGEGIEEIFKSVGVDIVIKGGQTMNPSTYELVKAIKKLDNEKIIIFPNNKNIILTATQAAKISKRDVIIIPTKTVPQGISAVLNFNKDLTLEENLKNMEDAYNNIKSGEITLAVRDANLLVGEIKKGDFIGLFDGKIKVVSDNVISAALELVKDMVDKNDSVITFYTGKDSKEEDKEKIREEISRLYPDLDMEFHNGGQPFYSYIFSIE